MVRQIGGSGGETQRRWAKAGRLFVIALFFAALFSISGVVVSCDSRAQSVGVSMVIDEAFAALFPDFSSSLAYLTGGAEIQTKGPAGKKRPAGSPPLPIGDLGGATARVLAGWEKAGSSMPKAVIASPLVADHLVGEIPPGRTAFPKLLVPFAGKELIGRGNVSSIEYDYATAYAAMGREAALQIRGG